MAGRRPFDASFSRRPGFGAGGYDEVDDHYGGGSAGGRGGSGGRSYEEELYAEHVAPGGGNVGPSFDRVPRAKLGLGEYPHPHPPTSQGQGGGSGGGWRRRSPSPQHQQEPQYLNRKCFNVWCK